MRKRQSILRKTALWFPVASLIFFVVSLCAEDAYLLEEGGIKIFFESPHEPVAREMAGIYPEIRTELENIFGWELRLTPSVLLIRDTRQFQQMIRSPLTVAFAIPEKDLIVIDHSKMSAHAFNLRKIFKHELCHLLLHRHIKNTNVPRWLDEGVAQWVSDGVGDIILDQKRSLLNKAAFGGQFIPLGSLADGFPHRDQDLTLAYEESRSFVDYIIGRFGKEGMLEILRHMERGLKILM